MEPGPIERKEAMDTTILDEKSLSATAPGNTTSEEEEKAARDAKLRPEREATFGDYIVSTSLNTSNQSTALLTLDREFSNMPSSGISSSWLRPSWQPRDQESYVHILQLVSWKKIKSTNGLSELDAAVDECCFW